MYIKEKLLPLSRYLQKVYMDSLIIHNFFSSSYFNLIIFFSTLRHTQYRRFKEIKNRESEKLTKSCTIKKKKLKMKYIILKENKFHSKILRKLISDFEISVTHCVQYLCIFNITSQRLNLIDYVTIPFRSCCHAHASQILHRNLSLLVAFCALQNLF